MSDDFDETMACDHPVQCTTDGVNVCCDCGLQLYVSFDMPTATRPPRPAPAFTTSQQPTMQTPALDSSAAPLHANLSSQVSRPLRLHGASAGARSRASAQLIRRLHEFLTQMRANTSGIARGAWSTADQQRVRRFEQRAAALETYLHGLAASELTSRPDVLERTEVATTTMHRLSAEFDEMLSSLRQVSRDQRLVRLEQSVANLVAWVTSCATADGLSREHSQRLAILLERANNLTQFINNDRVRVVAECYDYAQNQLRNIQECAEKVLNEHRARISALRNAVSLLTDESEDAEDSVLDESSGQTGHFLYVPESDDDNAAPLSPPRRTAAFMYQPQSFFELVLLVGSRDRDHRLERRRARHGRRAVRYIAGLNECEPRPEELDLCTICLTEEPGMKVVRLNCSHAFHRGCILEWAPKGQGCPSCRAAIGQAKQKKRKRECAETESRRSEEAVV